VHVDVKKPGRIAGPGHRLTRRADDQGWEYLRVCVDDATRLADVELLADKHPTSAYARS
jgi:hypothetical protein